MSPFRRILILLGAGCGVGGALALGGLAAHGEALVVTLARDPAAAPVGPVPLRLTVRNRLAAPIPIPFRGAGVPFWRLERHAAGAWEPLATPAEPSPSPLPWLLPFQRRHARIPIELPGRYRAVAFSGPGGEVAHATDPIEIDARELRDRPFAP